MRDAAAPHTLFGNREALIQRYIQQKHIHARLAEESPIRTLSELRDELLYFIRRNAARVIDAVVHDAKRDAVEINDLVFLVVHFGRAVEEFRTGRAEI